MERMCTTRPASPAEILKGPELAQFVNISSPIEMGNTPAVNVMFRQEFEVCQKHGKYPMNYIDHKGVERFVGSCPACNKTKLVEKLLEGSEIPKRFVGATFDNYDALLPEQKTALDTLKSYAANFERVLETAPCLILSGNKGTGKNHLMFSAAKEIKAQGHSVLALKLQDYLDTYWSLGTDRKKIKEYVSGLAAIGLLILDEIGRSSETTSAHNAIFRLLDARYENVKPTALLTNLDRNALKERLGAEAYDRLTQGGGKFLNFTWSSYRSIA